MTESKRTSLGRFRLRTLFVALTVIGIWLGWQMSVVQRRRQLINEMRLNSAFTFIMAQADESDSYSGAPSDTQTKSGQIPWIRLQLGDVGVARIVYATYHRDFSEAKRQRLEAVFSEANVVEELPPEPCHPGCFPHGTPIATPSGPRAIELIEVGDAVLAVGPDGIARSREVESVFRTSNWLWRVSTERGEFLTTETQPLCTSLETTVAAGVLRRGDQILVWVDERPIPVKVTGVVPTGRSRPVVNLVLGDLQYFIADGLLVRSKPPVTAAPRPAN